MGGGERGGKGKRVEERARKKRRNEGRREEGGRNLWSRHQCATKLSIFFCCNSSNLLTSSISLLLT